MTRNLVFAISVAGLAAFALPASAQDHAYDYQDETGSAWSNESPPPAEGSYSEYPGDDASARVDVNVDMATPGASVSFDTFQEGLSPYGEWVTVPGYGRAWRPAHVAAGWRPYYYGRWEWTDEGWLWVSDEPWGWATYHYGRWTYDGYAGWVWVPGYQWAPAWVTWRYSPDYIGWAPLGPGFSVYVTSYPINYAWWSFVPCTRFVGVPVYTVAYTGGYVRGIFHATQPAPPRAAVFGAPAPAWGGPARPFVEHRIGRTITPVRVQPVGSPAAIAAQARAGVVPIYRPELRPAPGRPAVAAPSRPWGGGAAPRSGAPVQAAPGVRAAPAPGGNGGWRGAPPAQAPARSWNGWSGNGAARPPQAAPRQPGPQGVAPRPMGPPPSTQRYAPAPQGARPPQGGFAPRPQGQGGGQAQHQGGHAAPAPAPHRHN
jgi:hypothetical protein